MRLWKISVQFPKVVHFFGVPTRQGAKSLIYKLFVVLIYDKVLFTTRVLHQASSKSEGSSNSEKVNVAKALRISREEFCHVFFLKAHEINHASVGNH